jgi:O-6-methylguanine DNA methyltransferase
MDLLSQLKKSYNVVNPKITYYIKKLDKILHINWLTILNKSLTCEVTSQLTITGGQVIESPFGHLHIYQDHGRIAGLVIANQPRELVEVAPWPGMTEVPQADCLSLLQFPSIPLLLKGTKFQQDVWQAMKQIPFGQTRSYQDLAYQMGLPNRYSRAVGGAVGKNAIALLLPCHRVIQQNGKLGGFRWGASIKKRILNFEEEAMKV